MTIDYNADPYIYDDDPSYRYGLTEDNRWIRVEKLLPDTRAERKHRAQMLGKTYRRGKRPRK